MLVGAGSLYLLRDREVAAATQRTGDLLPPQAMTVANLAGNGANPADIAAYLRQAAPALGVRFILLDEAHNVIVDTAGKQTGKLTDLDTGKNVPGVHNSYAVTGYQEGPTHWYAYMQTPTQITFLGQRSLTPRQYQLVMLVPSGTITSAWFDLAPRLLIAGVVALIASLGVAFFMARSITRPIKRITEASESMARGDYAQQIPVAGPEEVARLAASFNGMAVQVSGSHQMMRDLLANVAHELKTPLTSIQGFSQALADGVLRSPDEYATAARIINEESERMRRLVNDLLYLSQIESGQAPLDVQPLGIAALLQATAERVQWQAAERDVTLRIAASPNLPPALADTVRIEQVLANLLDNALRHTPAGGTITLLAEQAAPDRLRVAVHNTGSYIPPADLARVFERFYQVDRSRQRNGHNGGLGLAIAREIIVAHGGDISAVSDPDAGTTFALLLPVAQNRLPAPPHSPATPVSAA